MEEERLASILRSADLEVLGRMPWSSNGTYLVLVDCDDEQIQAVYKPEMGERPLRDFPDGIWRREVAAYELSAALDLEVVPVTVEREDGPFGEGSLQYFVQANYEEHYFTFIEDDRYDAALRRIAAFDLLANNADRKGGHILSDTSDHLWGIDNGLCFHVYDKLRTVMWDFAGDPVPSEALAWCERILTAVPGPVAAMLDDAECAALAYRAERLLAEPCFPAPDPERRSHPWPLV